MGESEEPAVEDEDSAYFWAARGLAPLGAVKLRRRCSKTTSEEKPKANSVVWTERRGRAKSLRRDQCVQRWNRHSFWACRCRRCRLTRRRVSASRWRSVNAGETSATKSTIGK